MTPTAGDSNSRLELPIRHCNLILAIDQVTALNSERIEGCGMEALNHLLDHVPHPHLEHRKEFLRRHRKSKHGFNDRVAVIITNLVGTMWCAYLFAILASLSLPEAIKAGRSALVVWIAQTFLQLVLLSIIMVGQRVAAQKSERQLELTYFDAEALLQISDEMHRLLRQNTVLTRQINLLICKSGSRSELESGPHFQSLQGEHSPHPHIQNRTKLAQPLQEKGGFNQWLAVKITNIVGSMWCAYAFAALCFISLPDAIRGGTAPLIAWICQTFLQLVLLSIIMVGQNVAAEKSDRQLEQTYKDAEALLQIHDEMHRLLKQNTELTEAVAHVIERPENGR